MIYEGHPDQSFGHQTFSHNGEDLLVLNLFRNIGADVFSYLDLGAGHPVHGSNTYLLYQRGCRGVCVDANSRFVDMYAADRPNDLFLRSAVSSKDGLIPYYIFSSTSGRNTCSLEEFVRVYPDRKPSIEMVKSLRLDHIVSEYCGGKWPDFLSCDLEGLDVEVLRSVDFDCRSGPKVICVEANTSVESAQLIELLAEREYHPFVNIGVNCFFLAVPFYHHFTWRFQP